MDARHKTIRVSRFVLSILKPMERISIDTIGLLPSNMGIKLNIVIKTKQRTYGEMLYHMATTGAVGVGERQRRTGYTTVFCTSQQRGLEGFSHTTLHLKLRDGHINVLIDTGYLRQTSPVRE